MSGIQITLTSEGQGFVRTTSTSTGGFFSFPDLTSASFTLSINAPGFKTYRQTGIAIGSSEQRSLGVIRLQLGELSDTVTITAEVAAVNLASGEKSGSLNSDELAGLALRGRDVFDAVSLMPGVVDTSDGRDAPGPTSISNIFIAGARNDQKNMTIDGVTNLDTGSNTTVHSMPSMDSVAELKVLSSNYAAEYGRNSGGTVTVITKGGGKAFHGSGNWYYRHEDLNGNDYFSNLAGRQRTPYRYNIVGYTIGGPILLPRVNRGRNKLFFFFSQEYQHQRVAYGTKMITVPTAAEREGDFSQSYDVNKKLIQVNDPLDSKRQFPGNTIPASRITKIGQNVLNIFPMPNYLDPNPSRIYSYNYFTSEAGGYNRRTEILRVDYSPRPNWQTYVRLSNNSDLQHAAYGLWVNGSLNYKITPIVFGQPGRGATVHSTNAITSTVFNELVAGVSQNTLTYAPEDLSKVDRTKLGIDIPQRNPSLNPFNMIPNMTFGGISNAANPSMSDGTPYFNRNTIYSLVDNLSKITGTHTIRMGIYLEKTRKVQFASAATRGTLAFDRDGNNPLDANNAYANALLGNYDSYTEANGRPKGDYRFRNTEWYAQDVWRVNRRLSLEYGVRFYHDPPQYDAKHQLASFLPALYNPATAPVLLRPGYDANNKKVAVDPRTGTVYPQGLIGSFAPGAGDPADGMFIGGKNGAPEGMYTMPAISVAPRFNFALDPFGRGKTAIRGGVGVFYDRVEGNPTMNTIGNPPTIFAPKQYYGTLADIRAQVSSGFLAPSGTVTSLAGSGRPVTYSYSLNISQQLGNNMLAEVSYVGNISRHQLWQRDINAVPLGSNNLILHPENRDPTTSNSALPANFMRPYQGFGTINMYEFGGSPNYNSVQASLSQRYKRGLSFGLAYTFSKVLDCSDSYSSSVDPFNAPRNWNYGAAGYDRTHVFSARFNYNLPKPGKYIHFRPVHWVGDNWQISGVNRIMSGAPFTPSNNLFTWVDYAWSTSATVRPTVIDPKAPVLQRFGPPSYPAPNVPTMGNIGRNILRGPGTNNWDLSLSRELKLAERIKGQLRLETYNTFNHTQFSGIDQSLRFDPQGNQINPLFMQATSARPPRRIQLSMRVSF